MATVTSNPETIKVIRALKDGSLNIDRFVKQEQQFKQLGVDTDLIKGRLQAQNLLSQAEASGGGMSGKTIQDLGSAVAGQAGDIGQGLASGATLGYYNPDIKTPLGQMAKFGAEFAPYIAADVATGGAAAIPEVAGLLSKAPTAARIARTALPMAEVGLVRPAKDLMDRLNNAKNEGLVGSLFGGAGELKNAAVNALKEKTLPAWFSKMGIMKGDQAAAILKNPKLGGVPLDKEVMDTMFTRVGNQTSNKVYKIIDEKMNGVKGIVKDLAGELSPKVKVPGSIHTGVSVQSLLSTGFQGIQDAIAQGKLGLDEGAKLSEELPKRVDLLLNMIKQKAQDGFAIQDNGTIAKDLTKVIPVDVAHDLKQSIYKLVRPMYQKDVPLSNTWADVYKDVASKINQDIGAISPEYAKANKAVTDLLGINDKLQNYGFHTWDTPAGADKLQNAMKNANAKPILMDLERKIQNIINNDPAVAKKLKDEGIDVSANAFQKIKGYLKTQDIRKAANSKGSFLPYMIGGTIGTAVGGANEGITGFQKGGAEGGIMGGLHGGVVGGLAGTLLGRTLGTPQGVGMLSKVLNVGSSKLGSAVARGLPRSLTIGYDVANPKPQLTNVVLGTDNIDKKGLK